LAGDVLPGQRLKRIFGTHRHVRVIEDQTAVEDRESEGQEPDVPAELPMQSRPRGFHVRPVPIDQPLSDA
jgi:hypothetical protein